MKRITPILVTLATLSTAHAKDLYVDERNPNTPSFVHRGLANGTPVLIKSYGSDAIESAHMFGRGLVINRYSFAKSKELIESRAEQLYAGHPAIVLWFKRDAGAAYDAEMRKERAL